MVELETTNGIGTVEGSSCPAVLYKYISPNRVDEVLHEGTLRFSYPSDFDDPFELEAAPHKRKQASNAAFDASLWTPEQSNQDSENDIDLWKEQYGILCLTRSKLNPLMWAHYSGGYRGIVIGVKIEETNFSQPSANLIPCQYGSVIYTGTRPTHDGATDAPKELKNLVCYEHEKRGILESSFLLKSALWSYEEEVRVVRQLGGDTRIYRLNEDAIVEIIFGKKAISEYTGTRMSDSRRRWPNANLTICDIRRDNWELRELAPSGVNT